MPKLFCNCGIEKWYLTSLINSFSLVRFQLPLPFMAKDKEKQRIASRNHYQRNRAMMKARAREYTAQQYKILAQYVRELKGSTPCMDCGKTYPHYVMDFDHVRGKKSANVADMVKNCVSLSKLKLEIEKCDIVCSNCHRTRTWFRLQEKVESVFDIPQPQLELKI